MRFRSLVLSLLLGLVPGRPDAAEDPAVRWLHDHALRLDPTSRGEDRFADLRPLAPLLSDRRVVILGEPTHGQGDVLALKARLVEYLHEELGFDVLAWEAGMYDVDLAWRRLQAGEPPLEALRAGLPQFWGGSAQVDGLLRYVAEQARGARPLEVVGLDTHAGITEEAQRRLVADLGQLAALLPEPAVTAAEIAAVEVLWDDSRPDGSSKGLRSDPEAVAAAVSVLAALRAALDRPEAIASLGAPRADWWRQCLVTLAHKVRSVQGDAADAWEPGMPLAPVFNPRDEALGANLLWLANERYPGRRIVVWSATMHAARRVEEIAGPLDYRGVAPMGHLAWLGLGDRLYALGFTTFEGEEHLPWMRATAIAPAAPGSFEDLARRAGLERAWVDLSSLPTGSPLSGAFRARPLGNLEMEAVWSRVLDGLLFVRRVGPSERRREGGAIPP